MLDGLRDVVASVERRLEAFELRFDRRLELVDQRFVAFDRRLEAFDRRFEAFDRRFEAFDAKTSRQFMWLCGLHVTTLVAVVVALAAR